MSSAKVVLPGPPFELAMVMIVMGPPSFVKRLASIRIASSVSHCVLTFLELRTGRAGKLNARGLGSARGGDANSSNRSSVNTYCVKRLSVRASPIRTYRPYIPRLISSTIGGGLHGLHGPGGRLTSRRA